VSLAPQESDLVGPKRLTKFEKVRLLAARAQQIAAGSPLFLKPDEIPEGVNDPLELAKLELEKGRLPFVIERNFLGRKERIPLNELLGA